MWTTFLCVLLVTYLPGLVIFRLPFARRELRAGLTAEERVFWYVVLSLALTSVVGLALAAAGWYRFDRLLWLNASVCGLGAALSGQKLRLPTNAPRPTRCTLIPLALVGCAALVFAHVPPAEHIIGGRDPGIYMNEGIQIAQRGALVIEDPVVASVPSEFRALFFQDLDAPTYFAPRFMAFFIIDPDRGLVVGQFPHLYPLWVAVSYGLNGLSGARQAVVLLAILGIVAVYFCGAWVLGRFAAGVGALLLILNVAEVWFSRYPNAEILVQVLAFSAILAFSRSTVDGDRFFAPLAATLLALSLFAHFSAVLVVGALGVAVLLGTVAERRPQGAFVGPLLLGLALATWYFGTVLEEYLVRPMGILQRAGPIHVAAFSLGLLGLGGILWGAAFTGLRAQIRKWLPMVLLTAVSGFAVYGYFFRTPMGRLAPHDAYALREFAQVYLSPLGLLMSLVGLGLLMRRSSWRGLAFVSTVIVFSSFIFYKIRIIPEHLWLARRFLPVILPAGCLLIGAVVSAPLTMPFPPALDRQPVRAGFLALGLVLFATVAMHFVSATGPFFSHVEYAGIIPRVEGLAARFEDGDLVLVEARDASDLHTLATPLAYIYARRVLVFNRASPDKTALSEFLGWARDQHRKVFFLGGNRSQLLSRSVEAVPISRERFWIPEYARSYPAFPNEVRLKEFNFGVYELVPRVTTSRSFDLDVGDMDDLYVQQFHDKETQAGRTVTFRWSTGRSAVLIPTVSSQVRTLTVWLNDGARPPAAARPDIDVYINDTLLGTATPNSSFQPYQFEIPAAVASDIEGTEEPAVFRLEGPTWSPRVLLGADDTRELGVMVDRVTLE